MSALSVCHLLILHLTLVHQEPEVSVVVRVLLFSFVSQKSLPTVRACLEGVQLTWCDLAKGVY